MTNLLKQPKMPLALKCVLSFLMLWGVAAIATLVMLEPPPTLMQYAFIYCGLFSGVVSAIVSWTLSSTKPAETLSQSQA